MMAIFFGSFGILCAAYYLLIVVYAGITADFAWIWIVLAILFEVLAFCVRYSGRHPGAFPGWLKAGVIGLFFLGAAVFCFLCGKVIGGMFAQGSEHLDYVVVLGAQVRGTVPSKALGKRLQRALEYAEANPDTILVLSGAQGTGEEITEAECMRRYLTGKGIPEERLILEERSTSTRENLLFSDELTGCGAKRTGIISNNFHIYRAVKLAEKLGYQHAEGIAAKSDPWLQVHYVVREAVALVKEKIVGNL